MAIEAGKRLGPYEILAPIGAGGMGEVYRARDTRLDRIVAVKILSSTSDQFRARFEREAKAISSLAHPHICILHDVGNQDGIDYLVMEHLEGETLADRLSRGPLPLDEALRYAMQIADALDKAHRRGITHRDLKPGNIMLTRTGAKLLDFGLAKQRETTEPQGVTLLTERKPITEEGMILGTFQYMAPEQLEGAPADARTDIFAFGVVVYEMLSGKRAFEGKTRSSVIAAILATEPQPLSGIQPLTPAGLERIVQLCLRKDPDERWQSIHDVKLELESLSMVPAAAPARGKSWAGWAAAALIAVLAIAFFIVDRGRKQPPQQRFRFEVMPPPNLRYNVVDGPALLSPDGTRYIVRLSGPDREPLHVREFDSTEIKPIRGTEGAYDPFWSPDGRHVAFFVSGKLRRVDLATSSVITICNGGETRGGTWAADGTILFSPSPSSPIHRVPSTGGTPQPVTKLDAGRKEIGHWRPSFLPDGRHFLFMTMSENSDEAGVFLGSLDSTEVHRVLPMATPAVYAPPGYLVYLNDFELYAQPFDLERRATTGDGFLIARGVEYNGQYGTAGFSVSRNGRLVFHRRGPEAVTSLIRMPVDGDSETRLSVDGVNIDLSRDGTRLAMNRIPAQQRNSDIWTYDLRRGISTRITFEPTEEIGAVWSGDGKTLIYAVAGATTASVRTRPSGGGGQEEIIFTGSNEQGMEIIDWTRDGRYLLAEGYTPATRMDLLIFDMTTKKITPFAKTPFAESSGRFSPDGKWITYQSDDTGRSELYLQPFPPDGSRSQISSGGGSSPRWSASGRLFFVNGESQLMSVEISTANGLAIGTPVKHRPIGTNDYVLMPDGKEVIISRRDASTTQPLEVITNVF